MKPRSRKGRKRRTVAAASLLWLAACANTDARPDEFSLEVGAGDYDGSIEGRSMDGGGTWASAGLTWYLDAATPPARAAAALDPVGVPAAAPAPTAQPEATPEPQDEPLPVPPAEPQDWPWAGLPAFGAVLAAAGAGVAGWTYREAVWRAIRAAAGWVWSWLGRLLRRARPARRPRR